MCGTHPLKHDTVLEHVCTMLCVLHSSDQAHPENMQDAREWLSAPCAFGVVVTDDCND